MQDGQEPMRFVGRRKWKGSGNTFCIPKSGKYFSVCTNLFIDTNRGFFVVPNWN